ncbi:glycosyltransferase family 4 protein [Novosphingobium terrae]|uniref:glycosyltransferase family 4 protein n=1 Tax=Novosphingobium terrae TaxID=2726189 RepID=UPI00197FD66F|nr:glycosyltransferase family 4 protein [Novosphingobium terrae]
MTDDFPSLRDQKPSDQLVAEVVDLFASEPRMPRLRVALIGTYTPRRCGIATFTCDIREKLAAFVPDIDVDVYALDQKDSGLAYEDHVRTIEADSAQAYARAARLINESGADVVWLQHEFGIFGGPDGDMVRELVDGVAAPLLITFHTVLAEPSAGQRAVTQHLLERASKVMVMSRHGADLLTSTYKARPEIVEIIEHGAPDRPFGGEEGAKARMGLDGKQVLTTFGLLGPGKGLEQVIEALPAIIARHPQVVYRILGATHPVLLARDGESYREGLIARAQELGVAQHIVWENRFLDTDELLDQLEACDIYITPYPNLGQSTSGTLSYAVALGKAVVSTPYVHARELLADGVGCLIDTNAPDAIAQAVNALLDNPKALMATKLRAYQRGRQTIWPQFAKAGAALVRETMAPSPKPASPQMVPGLSAVFAMSDATGMLQHAVGIVPDRRHGYCLDDNARALMLMNVSTSLSESERMRWSICYAAFVQYAWNPDKGRFRNFMNFDRTWCETEGSEDSNGRALWALGHTVEHSPLPDIKAWALDLFDTVLEGIEPLQSPRAMGFAALGSLALMRAGHRHGGARDMVIDSCNMLAHLLDKTRRPDWAWFEAVLGYDNPRLCQVLIEAGHLLGEKNWLAIGLETLDWISRCQTGIQGHFRPIGSESFGRQGTWQPFDQQPLEAQAAIEAAHSAFVATGEKGWTDQALQVYQWFFGANDRGVVLADIATGRCRDGVTPRGRNENSGAESILAFQLGHHSLSRLLRRLQPPQFTQAVVSTASQTPIKGINLGQTVARPVAQSAAYS